MPKVTKYTRLRTHVRKSVSGRVRVYYFYDRRPEGLPDVALGTDYADAIEKWRELHEHKPRIRGTAQEAFGKFRSDVLDTYENARTKTHYRRQLGRLEAVFGGMIWEDITLPILREYLDRRVSKAKRKAGAPAPTKPTIAKTQGNREMSLFSIVWGKARLWGMTKLPWPAAGVKNWKHEEKARDFEVTDALFNAVYEVAEPMLRDAMDISTATGMRLTDVRTVRLPTGDILRLKASKTGKAADYDLSMSQVLPGLVERRRALQALHVMLLSTPDGYPVTVSMLRGAYDRAREQAIVNHPELAADLRRMFLRDMRKRASDLAPDLLAAQALLQHDDPRITAKHYRASVTKLNPVR